MTGIGDDEFLNISRGGAHDDRHGRAKRLLAADGKDWHRQHALSDEGRVVDSILVEGRELGETGVHRTGLRIQPGVVFAGVLAERLGISRNVKARSMECTLADLTAQMERLPSNYPRRAALVEMIRRLGIEIAARDGRCQRPGSAQPHRRT